MMVTTLIEEQLEQELAFDGLPVTQRKSFPTSCMMAFASYNRVKNELVLTFHNGVKYRYPGVLPEVVEPLFAEAATPEGAISAGKWFHANMRKQPCERVGG